MSTDSLQRSHRSSLVGSNPGYFAESAAPTPDVASNLRAPRAPEPETTNATADAPRRLARLLRIIGGAFLLTSASTFLLHRWDHGSDLMRYGVLLLHTLLLVVAGLFCGFRLRESRSARTFLALTLAVAPVNAAVLGGLVYSRFAQDTPGILPSEFLWVAPSAFAALACVALAGAVLLPLAWFAYRTLARPRASALLTVFAATNALLLVPWRNPSLIAPLAVLATALVAQLDARQLSRHPAMTTLEGRLARATLLLPIALLFARGVVLYPSNWLDIGTLALTISLLIGRWLRQLESAGHRSLAIIAASAAFGAGWASWCQHTALSGWLEGAWHLPVLLVPMSLWLVWLSRGTERARPMARVLAALLVLVACIPNVWLYPGLGTLMICACSGALVLSYGAWVKSKVLSLGGALAVTTAISYQVVGSIEFDMLTHWAFLSSLGMLLIVLASYWEKHQARVLGMLRRWQASANAWDY